MGGDWWERFRWEESRVGGVPGGGACGGGLVLIKSRSHRWMCILHLSLTEAFHTDSSPQPWELVRQTLHSASLKRKHTEAVKCFVLGHKAIRTCKAGLGSRSRALSAVTRLGLHEMVITP